MWYVLTQISLLDQVMCTIYYFQINFVYFSDHQTWLFHISISFRPTLWFMKSLRFTSINLSSVQWQTAVVSLHAKKINRYSERDNRLSPKDHCISLFLFFWKCRRESGPALRTHQTSGCSLRWKIHRWAGFPAVPPYRGPPTHSFRRVVEHQLRRQSLDRDTGL